MRAVILLLVLTGACTARYGRGGDSQSINDRAVAVTEIVLRRTSDASTFGVVDSGALRSVVNLDSAGMAYVAQRLPINKVVGAAEPTGICAPKDNRSTCLGIRFSSFSERRNSFKARVAWFPVGGCGGYEATFRVKVRAGKITQFDVSEEDFGQCSPLRS